MIDAHRNRWTIDLNRVLLFLFHLYAFSLPFELVLEFLFDIDTIFKPFRVLSLVIIGVYVLKILNGGLHLHRNYRSDLFLYAVFAYGILISLIRIVLGQFNMALFFNDLFQSGLYLATFFIYKSLPISRQQGLQLFQALVLGLTINAAYTYYNYANFIVGGRQAGFMDNPNYAALGIVAVTAFLLLRTGYLRSNFKILFNYLLILFLMILFGVAGSRTGFVMFLVVIALVFYFSSIRKKAFFIFSIVLIGLFLLPNQLEDLSTSGPGLLFHRLNRSIVEGEEDVRFVVWRGAFRVFEDAGYAGMGIGQFKAKFPYYFSEESNGIIMEMVNRGYFLTLHNDYLAILADYGLPSLVFYLMFLSFSFGRLWHRLRQKGQEESAQFFTQLTFILFACLIIYGMAAENFQHQLFWFLLMFSTKNYT